MTDLTLTRTERIVILMRRANLTNAILADRCGNAAGRDVTHQMVSALLRGHNWRKVMSERVRLALLEACEAILEEVER